MKKEQSKKWLYALLLILWMGIIFAFSAQPAEESGKISDSICYKLVSGANHTFHMEWGAEQMEGYALRLSLPVRKAAHMTEYAILAMLVWGNLMVRKCLSGKHSYMLAFLFAVLYAMTDEYHQTFVAGRSGNLTDVCIDGLGACLGLLCLALVSHWCGSRKYKQRKGK